MLITGTTGFVGARLLRDLPGAAAAPSLRGMTEEALYRMVEESGAEVIIHTAAMSDIGACQKDPEGSWEANVLLPERLARACRGRKLICFSSDQVYSGCSGEGPYREDAVCAGNLYAQEKIEMEQRVLAIDPDAVMLRAEWMYDAVAPKPNYYLNILQGGVPTASSHQHRGVTYLREVSEAMPAVMQLPGGAYNFGSETPRSFYEVTQIFLRDLGREPIVQEGPDRHNLWMDCSLARHFGVYFSEVNEGLRRCARDAGVIRE